MVKTVRPDHATSVVAWFYPTQKQAFRALLSLQELDRSRGLKSLGAIDAAVMSASSDGRLTIDGSIEFKQEALGALKVIFPGDVLARSAPGRADDRVAEHFSAIGLPVNVMRDITENMPPGGAALVVLLREEWLDELRTILAGADDVERWALEVEGPAAP